MSNVIGRLSEEIEKLITELSEANAEIERLQKQLVKAQALLREFLPAAVADDARQRAAAFLTDEMRCDPDKGLPTAEDVRGILAPVTSAVRGQE